MSNMKDAFNKAGYKQEKSPVSKPITPVAKFDLPENYAERARQVIWELKNTREKGVKFHNFTTSKIRNILALISEIYNDVILETNNELNQEIISRLEYVKVRLIYESGREPEVVKPFVNKAGLLLLLNNIGNSRENFIRFARYMEALVAYHRFYNGKE